MNWSSPPFLVAIVAINLPGILHGEQILSRDARHFILGDLKRLRDPCDADGASELRMPLHEAVHRFGRSWLADAVRDVDGEEVRARKKAVHRFEADVIRINVPAATPAGRLDGGLCGIEHALRFGTDEGVFAIGFVPDRRHLDAPFGEQLEGAKLGPGLVRKRSPTRRRSVPVSTQCGGDCRNTRRSAIVAQRELRGAQIRS